MAKLALGMADLAIVLVSYAALGPLIPQKMLLKISQLDPKLLQDAKQAHVSKW